MTIRCADMNTEAGIGIAHATRGRDGAIPDTVAVRRRTSRPRPTSGSAATSTGSVSSTSGCGAGENAVAMARQGAHVIAIDASIAQLALGRKLADAAEVRVEWHECDAADLAFLRADSIDLALAAGCSARSKTSTACFRQVHRVLRPGRRVRVLATTTRWRLAVGREDDEPGALPLGALEVRRSYFDTEPDRTITHDDERIQVWPRTIADVFAGAAPRRLPRRGAARAGAARSARSRPRRSPRRSSGAPAKRASSRVAVRVRRGPLVRRRGAPTRRVARTTPPRPSRPLRGGARAGTSSASPTIASRRHAEELHHRVAVERGPELRQLLLLLELGDARLELVHAPAERGGLLALRVVQSQRVSSLRSSSNGPASRT